MFAVCEAHCIKVSYWNSFVAHCVISSCLDTLNIYVCPSSIIFARIGNTPTDSALADVVMVAIPLDTCLTIVQLRTLLQNRLHPSLQEDRFNWEIITLLQHESVHIEPGSQLYKGGNVMILFLGLSLFLISTECVSSHVLGFILYIYYHYLLILGPLTFIIYTLWFLFIPIPFLFFTTRQELPFTLLYHGLLLL